MRLDWEVEAALLKSSNFMLDASAVKRIVEALLRQLRFFP